MPVGGFAGGAAATAVLRITTDTKGANQSLGNRGLGGSLKSLVPSAENGRNSASPVSASPVLRSASSW